MKKNRRRWLGLGLALAVLALILFHLSRSSGWQSFSWDRLWFLLTHLNSGLLVLAILASCVTYLARAYRWRFFVDPVKRCSLWRLFKGQVYGFSSVYLVGRAGEVVRPAYIAKSENLPFTSQVAVWILERIYDALALVIVFASAVVFEKVLASGSHPVPLIHEIRHGAWIVLALSVCGIAVLAAFRLYSDRILARLDQLLAFTPERFREKLISILRSFSTGLEVIQNLRDFLASVWWTAVLWILNVTVIWLTLRSLGGSFNPISWWSAGVILVISSVGLIVQIPGIGGGYQVAEMLALHGVFHVPPSAAAGAAILTWVTVMAPCLIMGIVLLCSEGFGFRKLLPSVSQPDPLILPKA